MLQLVMLHYHFFDESPLGDWTVQQEVMDTRWQPCCVHEHRPVLWNFGLQISWHVDGGDVCERVFSNFIVDDGVPPRANADHIWVDNLVPSCKTHSTCLDKLRLLIFRHELHTLRHSKCCEILRSEHFQLTVVVSVLHNCSDDHRLNLLRVGQVHVQEAWQFVNELLVFHQNQIFILSTYSLSEEND